MVEKSIYSWKIKKNISISNREIDKSRKKTHRTNKSKNREEFREKNMEKSINREKIFR